MNNGSFIFPREQARYLEARMTERMSDERKHGPHHTSLVHLMPPVYHQALRGSCVANAVTAMLEYYGDCKTRLSVQFLAEATRLVERRGLERNLTVVTEGGTFDPEFEAVFHAQLLQLKILADVNGRDSAAYRTFAEQFKEGARTRFRTAEGSLIRSTFAAVTEYGICRHALWPYAGSVAAPVFGGEETAAFPPGSREDAAKRRGVPGLYILRTPNNVDEIRGILAGANNRRPMPVCVTLPIFEGCDGARFSFPATTHGADGTLVTENKSRGLHAVVIVGYVDDLHVEGGGFFIVRNSWGEKWGEHGYGSVPYAYVECFATEAGTILQDMVDYAGDGYDGLRHSYGGRERRRNHSTLWWLVVNLLIALAVVILTVLAGIWFDDPLDVTGKKKRDGLNAEIEKVDGGGESSPKVENAGGESRPEVKRPRVEDEGHAGRVTVPGEVGSGVRRGGGDRIFGN